MSMNDNRITVMPSERDRMRTFALSEPITVATVTDGVPGRSHFMKYKANHLDPSTVEKVEASYKIAEVFSVALKAKEVKITIHNPDD